MHVIAAIQMVSGPERDINLAQAGELIKRAAQQGAKLIVLPENFAHMGIAETDKLALREQPGDGPIQTFLSQQAQQHGVWLVGGTIPMAGADPKRVRAACLLYDDRGAQVARYDKIHLFDVSLSETNETYRESDTIEPGDQMQVVQTPFGRIGLAVCYDLRFPEMFRAMAHHGLDLIVLPAAFTATTGLAHWEVLLRARAVENLCYVAASGQGGHHANGRDTFGHSMIIDPWGKVLAQTEQGAGLVTATLDPTLIQRLQRNFPALQHRRKDLWT
ncbi:MAG: carbon-nitrogen hydrolase family protein [Gammaproteobacteria bacterium]|nr:carbon-nitrogen hydrolase family protein [Gammaproteobacteria bacterium]